MAWKPVKIDQGTFLNVDEAALEHSAAALENCYVNDGGGHSRFPGMRRFVDLKYGRVYLDDWRDDMVAVTSAGKVYRIDYAGKADDVTGVVPPGGTRPIFTKTDDQLVIASGGALTQLRGPKTTTQFTQANIPDATHAGYLDGFLIFNERASQRFWRSNPGDFTTVPPLAFNAAEAKPDDITALIVSEFRELFLAGPQSIEMWEPYPGGDAPFFRRWAVSEGIHAPYTLVTGDGGTWCVTSFREFSRIAGQRKEPASQQINAFLQAIDDWTDAWAAQAVLFGQRFIFLVIPNATNLYGTKGVALLFDYIGKRWHLLYGWDAEEGVPGRWPAWSYRGLWGRYFVGGDNGIIYELTKDTYAIDGAPQRLYFRSAHFDELGHVHIDKMRLRCKRGAAQSGKAGMFRLRSRRDGYRWSRWQERSMGARGDQFFYLNFGAQGDGKTWQWEWQVTDDCPVEIVRLEVDAEPMED